MRRLKVAFAGCAVAAMLIAGQAPAMADVDFNNDFIDNNDLIDNGGLDLFDNGGLDLFGDGLFGSTDGFILFNDNGGIFNDNGGIFDNNDSDISQRIG